MKRAIVRAATIFIFTLLISSILESVPLPRRVAALYDSKIHGDAWFSEVLQYAAMPIEHAGLTVTYYDVQEGFPPIHGEKEFLGAVVWDIDPSDSRLSRNYLDWAVALLEKGKKLVVMGPVPGIEAGNGSLVSAKRNKFWKLMGLSSGEPYLRDSFGVQFLCKEPFACNFEREYRGRLPLFLQVELVDPNSTLFLSAKIDENNELPLIVTTSSGGYASEGYALYRHFHKERDYLQWYINPFIFFEKAFGKQNHPKPDVTTLSGRRIYYSHIDGDGWNSISMVGAYRTNKDISAKVILEQVIAPFGHLPVTVSPIAADIDPNWEGLLQSQEVAKALFLLPQVEIGSHTYSHPFDWAFFKDYTPGDERPYLEKFPFRTWEDNDLLSKISGFFSSSDEQGEKSLEREFHYPKKIGEDYTIPRAFANEKFDIDKEISGSKNFIDNLAPEGKKVEILQWSGDCRPFPKALELTRRAGLLNINGGDSRFDTKYDSYAWVRPLGRNVGRWRQVYSSMSNENLYTDFWTKHFYAFNQLRETFKNCGIPIRLRPLNLYYHMYSGEKHAALEALLQNIEYVESEKITPVETSRYAQIVNGFHSIEITPIGEKRWLFSNRGALQTIRFDDALYSAVDIEHSRGVIGQTHLYGSLYVALDSSVDKPIIALIDNEEFYKAPSSPHPYLVDANWDIYNLERRGADEFSFTARGYGIGEFIWHLPEEGRYSVTVGEEKPFAVYSNGPLLEFIVDKKAIQPIKIAINKEKFHEDDER